MKFRIQIFSIIIFLLAFFVYIMNFKKYGIAGVNDMLLLTFILIALVIRFLFKENIRIIVPLIYTVILLLLQVLAYFYSDLHFLINSN
jgi:hypothetical protein